MQPPKCIWIEPTNICNQSCSWCFQSNGTMTRSRGMMTMETYMKIISDITSFKPEISLHLAGESLLHKDINQFIRIAKENGLTVGITTNGTLLRKNNFEILKTGIDSINISLAGINENDYSVVRKNAAFESIRNDIIYLCQKKVLMGSSCKIYVNITATEQNKDQVYRFKENFEKLEGLNGVIIRPLMSWSNSVSTKDMSIKGIGYPIRKLVKKITFMYMLYTLTNNIIRQKRIKNRIYCESVNRSSGILWDGTVVPCCLDFNGTIKLGNINDRNFLSIWNGEEMNELRKNLSSLRGIRSNPLCGSCIMG